MGRLTMFACAVSLLLALSSVSAQIGGDAYRWVLKRDSAGIRVFTSKVDGSRYRAVSGSMEVKGSVASLVELVMDFERCSEWASMCKVARLEKKISATESLIYSRNNIPFPVRDRDTLSRIEWSRDAVTGKVMMVSHATSGQLDKVKGVVRIEYALARWHFTPLSDGKVRVESFIHLDPNGPIPVWLVNSLLVGSPYKTLKKMRKIIESGDYADAQLTF